MFGLASPASLPFPTFSLTLACSPRACRSSDLFWPSPGSRRRKRRSRSLTTPVTDSALASTRVSIYTSPFRTLISVCLTDVRPVVDDANQCMRVSSALEAGTVRLDLPNFVFASPIRSFLVLTSYGSITRCGSINTTLSTPMFPSGERSKAGSVRIIKFLRYAISSGGGRGNFFASRISLC